RRPRGRDTVRGRAPLPALGRAADRDRTLRGPRLADRPPARHRHDFRLPRHEPPRHLPVRGRLSARLPRGRGHGPRLPAPAANGRGSGRDAHACRGPLLDHRLPLALLHGQGLAGPLRRAAAAPPRDRMIPTRLTLVAALAVALILVAII